MKRKYEEKKWEKTLGAIARILEKALPFLKRLNLPVWVTPLITAIIGIIAAIIFIF